MGLLPGEAAMWGGEQARAGMWHRRVMPVLHQAELGHGDRLAGADHQVVEQADVHQRQRLAQLAGEALVGSAGLG